MSGLVVSQEDRGGRIQVLEQHKERRVVCERHVASCGSMQVSLAKTSVGKLIVCNLSRVRSQAIRRDRLLDHLPQLILRNASSHFPCRKGEEMGRLAWEASRCWFVGVERTMLPSWLSKSGKLGPWSDFPEMPPTAPAYEVTLGND